MRKDRFVVGFEREGEVVYGKDTPARLFDYTHPMTILQAIRQLKTLSGKPKAIFKLVKVDPKDEKFKQKIINQMVKK